MGELLRRATIGLLDASSTVLELYDVDALDSYAGDRAIDELRAYVERVGALGGSLRRVLDRESTLYPAAIIRLSPGTGPDPAGVIVTGDDRP